MPTNLLGQWIPESDQSFAAALADIYRHLGVYIRAATGDDFRQKAAAAAAAGLIAQPSQATPAVGFVGGRFVTYDGATLRISSARQMLSGTEPGTKPIPNGGNAQYRVRFPQRFIAVPRIFVQTGLSARLTTAVHSVTTDEFQVSVDNKSGGSVPGGGYTLEWFALE